MTDAQGLDTVEQADVDQAFEELVGDLDKLGQAGFSEEQIERLQAKLPAKAVKARKQGGQQLSYIEAHYAIRRANEIFGFDGWSQEELINECISQTEGVNRYGDAAWSVSYRARVRVTVCAGDKTVVREDTGYGHGSGMKDLGLAHESAGKEAVSDALKRALRTFGDQFGLALYDKDKPNVEGEVDEPLPTGKKRQRKQAEEKPPPNGNGEKRKLPEKEALAAFTERCEIATADLIDQMLVEWKYDSLAAVAPDDRRAFYIELRDRSIALQEMAEGS